METKIQTSTLIMFKLVIGFNKVVEFVGLQCFSVGWIVA